MFLASTLCQRELILADMLKKPIIPVMFEMTAWPPIGAASLILTPLTYVDLKGKHSSNIIDVRKQQDNKERNLCLFKVLVDMVEVENMLIFKLVIMR